MLYFPQLTTGAASQFPCTKRVAQRTAINDEADGGTVKLFDPGACRVEWNLGFRGLAIEEWAAIDELFGAVEGRLGTFGFLDPFGNLLKWSDDLSAAAWQKDGAIVLSGGSADALGGTRATLITNSSGTEQNIRQTVAAPGWFQYCMSVYVRSDVPAAIRLFASAGTETGSQVFPALNVWRRVEFPILLTSREESVTFGAAIEGGTAVELFGFQAEAQPGASKYKRTSTHGGMFPNASFLEDELRMTSNASGEFSCTVRIGATAS